MCGIKLLICSCLHFSVQCPVFSSDDTEVTAIQLVPAFDECIAQAQWRGERTQVFIPLTLLRLWALVASRTERGADHVPTTLTHWQVFVPQATT